MFAKYQINISTISSASTATTINLPVNLEFQIVDNSELIDRLFVDVETQNAVNPILDYEKVRFTPVDNLANVINTVNYNLFFLSGTSIAEPTYYSGIGFDDSDINFGRSNFKESFLNLSFYDDPNPLTQNLVTEIQIFNKLTQDDLIPVGTTGATGQPKPIPGRPKPSSQIPIRFVLSNPVVIKRAFYDGYYIYNYKDEFSIGFPKYLYMSANYFNAKLGTSTNLMTEPTPYKINELISKLYTRYKLYRDTTGFYYQVDETYSNNVNYLLNPNKSDIFINLYQIQTL